MKKIRVLTPIEVDGVPHSGGFVDVSDEAAAFLVANGAASIVPMMPLPAMPAPEKAEAEDEVDGAGEASAFGTDKSKHHKK